MKIFEFRLECLTFVIKVPIDNKPALFQMMAGRLLDNKPIAVPVMAWRINASLGLNGIK